MGHLWLNGFTKLLKPVMSIRQQGVRSIVFLDDMLFMAGFKERLLKQVPEVVQLLQLLGFVIIFVIIFEKSQLNPTQKIQYQSTRGEGCKDQTGMSVGPAA